MFIRFCLMSWFHVAWKLEPAFRAGLEVHCHIVFAVRALFRLSLAVAFSLAQFIASIVRIVQRSMPLDVLTEVQNQTVAFTLAHPQTTPHDLSEQPWRHSRSKHCDGVDARRVESCR